MENKQTDWVPRMLGSSSEKRCQSDLCWPKTCFSYIVTRSGRHGRAPRAVPRREIELSSGNPPPFNLPTKIHLKRITSNLYLNLKHDSRVVPDGYRLLPENVFSLAELFD